MRTLVTASVLALAGCSSTGNSYSDRWDELAAEHHRQIATPEGAAWETAFLPVHNAFWRDVHKECAGPAKAAGIAEFRAIAVVGIDGVVDDFLVNPNRPELACFTKQMVGRQYPAPPVAPFYELFNMRIRIE